MAGNRALSVANAREIDGVLESGITTSRSVCHYEHWLVS
jgi:hypothetical protein